MHRASSKRSIATPAFVEQLETREFLSVSTKTSISASAAAALIGQTVSLTVKVKPATGTTVPHGTIEILDNGKKTGITRTLTHKGTAVVTFDPSAAIFVGTYNFSARFVSSTTSFVGSKSKAAKMVVGAPNLTNLKDGLELATVTNGSGKAAKTGQSLTCSYTGFYATDGSVFDDSAAHSPGTFTFTLYANPEQVIAGFDEGAKGMKPGETRVLVIPSALGYNDGKVRIFILHLVSLK